VWTEDPAAERISHLHDYLTDRSVRIIAWQRRAQMVRMAVNTTPAHLALAELERRGRLRAIITQNTDGLHQLAGSSPSTVLEMHGSTKRWRCEDCGAGGPIEEQLDRLAKGVVDPGCPACGGITRATVVLFGEALDHSLLTKALEVAESCDLMIAIGSTLVVSPVSSLVASAIGGENPARLIIVNADPTPFDRYADLLFDDDIQSVLPALVHAT
jgi:NAD-dependent deacetylase